MTEPVAVDNRFRQLSHVITFAPTSLAMIWLVVAIAAGLVLGKLLGFMTVEFVMSPCFWSHSGELRCLVRLLSEVVGYSDSER